MEIHSRKDLLKWLEANAEPDYANFSKALIPDLKRPMLGIRIPKLRALAQSIVKSGNLGILNEKSSLCSFEEVMFYGLVIAYEKADWCKNWTDICNFVPFIDNWSVCDSCCASFKAVRCHREEAWPGLLKFLHSDDEYSQRFAVVMMMDHFLTDEYIDRVLEAWTTVRPKGHYAEMAIGWGLSVSFLSYPDKTLKVLLDERVPIVCRKKACQKILESKRTSKEGREQIKKLKSKY